MIAAVYVRKSTEQAGVSDDQKSVARQIDNSRQYAERKGWTVEEQFVYVDDGISGAEFTNRPGFLRLMNTLKPRAPFQVLVMSEESRLGREAIETAYALKQIMQAGVRVFFYLEDRERTLDSPTDKIMLSLTAFSDELEREKARQRTRDAMLRKAKAGHVTGGSCFGYRNVDVAGADGKRSHVVREIVPAQAEVIRQIFSWSAEGFGLRAIAKRLNDQGSPSPRAQQGRSQSWAPTSVREVLHRPLYRGEIVWAQTAKRNKWGQHHQTAKPEADWIRRAAPELRIVTDEAWTAAHGRISAVRTAYFRTAGSASNARRPALGESSKYLLGGLTVCGGCQGLLTVRSRSHGTSGRKFFYGCSAYHNRGRSVCANSRDLSMEDANEVVIEALLDEVLDESMVQDAIDEAMTLIHGADPGARLKVLDAELGKIERERARYVAAIAAGGDIPELVEAHRAREARRVNLEAERRAFVSQRPSVNPDQVRGELLELAHAWRRVLADDPTNARPIVSSLLIGRVSFTPLPEPKRWRLNGQGTLIGLFTRDLVPSRWRPQEEPHVKGIDLARLFRAA